MNSHAPVVFVMIDGLRPDAIAAANCTNLQALCERGASTLAARSVMPSYTLPCHMSIFHSVPPTRHGITSNMFQPMARPLPGLFDYANLYNKRCSAIYNWEPLRDLGRPESLTFSWFRNSYLSEDGDDEIVAVAIEHIQRDRPDFVFVYLGTVDTYGHLFGWMSDEYLQQAHRADALLGRLLATLSPAAHVLVHADHGGLERNHGNDTPEEMTIPWVLSGPQVRKGYTIREPVSLLDTAPTLARLLDCPVHPHWEGRCIEEALLAE